MSSTNGTSSATSSAGAGVLAKPGTGAAAAGTNAQAPENLRSLTLPILPDLSTLRVPDLRAELEARNLASGGLKNDLVVRLQSAALADLCRGYNGLVHAVTELLAAQQYEQQQDSDDSQDDDDDDSQDSFSEMLAKVSEIGNPPGARTKTEAEPSSPNTSDDNSVLQMIREEEARICVARAHRPGAGDFDGPRGGGTLRDMIAEAVERQMLPLREEMANLRAQNDVLADDVFRLRAQLRRLQGKKEAGAGSGEEEKKGEEEDE